MIRNRKGSSVDLGFLIMFNALIISVFLGVSVYVFNLITVNLGQDVDVGQTNLQIVTDSTLGQLNLGLASNADLIGITLLFGMCFLMIMNGYFIGRNNSKLFFIIDMFLLILFFIPAVYISQVYEILITANTPLSGTFTDVISGTSRFMLNLPIIIGSVGVLTMILSYSGIRRLNREPGDGSNVLGY